MVHVLRAMTAIADTVEVPGWPVTAMVFSLAHAQVPKPVQRAMAGVLTGIPSQVTERCRDGQGDV
jgi:hypothetical protein